MPVEDVDVFALVDVEGGKDLAGITVRKCDKLPIREIMQQMQGKVSKIKTQKDENIKKQIGAAK